MAERILPEASLSPTAQAVDRFAAPQTEYADDGGLGQLAESLSRLNPELQKFVGNRYAAQAEEETAAGVAAESDLSPSVNLRSNREGWREIIAQQRKVDREQGTDNATALVGASPHFRRGLVQAKANRIGMGAGVYLQQQWQKNVDGVQSMDDPAAVQEWIQSLSADYAERMGVADIDPVIQAEIFLPKVEQAQARIMNTHMTHRAQARVSEWRDEYSGNVGMMLNGGSTGASPVNEFINMLAGAESRGSGGYSAENDLGYTGLLQFGQDRLTDFNRANDTSYSMAQFKASEAIQDRVNVWHINDIDQAIAERGYTEEGYSLDGLRAVAHLGGIGGMHEFVRTGGAYNPNDAYTRNNGDEVKGTSLQDYYKRFSATSTGIEAMAEQAVASGIDPTEVNQNTVTAVIAQAVSTGDASQLDVLNDISTGNGPLGNIGWVKMEVVKAREQIEDQAWQEETRGAAREERARAERSRELRTGAYEAVMADPFGDHTGIMEDARAEGFTSIVDTVMNLRERLVSEAYTVRTNHEAVVDLRADIFRGAGTQDELLERVVAETGINFPSNIASQLIDDIKTSGANADYIRDADVRNWIGNMRSEVTEAVEQRDMFGNILTSGRAAANRAELELQDDLMVFLEDNPEVTLPRVRQFIRKRSRELTRDYAQQTQTNATATQGTDGQVDPLAGYSPSEIAVVAAEKGLTTEQFITEVYEATGYTP